MRHGLDILGGIAPQPTVDDREAWMAMGAGVVGGIVGMALWPAHPVLAFMDGYDLGGAAMDIRTGARSKGEIARQLGRTAIATVASLALPVPHALGWIAGAIAGHLILKDGDESSVVDRAFEISGKAKDWAIVQYDAVTE